MEGKAMGTQILYACYYYSIFFSPLWHLVPPPFQSFKKTFRSFISNKKKRHHGRQSAVHVLGDAKF